MDSDPSSEEEAEQTSQLKPTYLTVDSEGNDKNNKMYIPKNWREFKERDMKLPEVCDADKQSEDPMERLNQSTSELSESVNCEDSIHSDTERGLYCNTCTYSYQIDLKSCNFGYIKLINFYQEIPMLSWKVQCPRKKIFLAQVLVNLNRTRT